MSIITAPSSRQAHAAHRTDGQHLTGEYAAVPGELKEICTHFGKSVLREVPEEARPPRDRSQRLRATATSWWWVYPAGTTFCSCLQLERGRPGLIEPADRVWAVNGLLQVLDLQEFAEPEQPLLGVLLRLGEVDGDVQVAVFCPRHPFDVRAPGPLRTGTTPSVRTPAIFAATALRKTSNG